MTNLNEIDRPTFSAALDALNPRQRRIFESRRLTKDPMTLAELADEFGVSRERVSHIEARAFEKVQKIMNPASTDPAYKKLVATIREARAGIVQAFLYAAGGAMELGEALIAAKDEVPPDQWERFLRRCGISAPRAEAYMNLAGLKAAPSRRTVEIIAAEGRSLRFTLQARHRPTKQRKIRRAK
jgi:hypothetical protein